MSSANYGECERRVLLTEGGYTNDPHDPGGPTNRGITITDARLYWKHDASAEDVRDMPLSVAQQIYREKYWDALDCDELPPGVDYTVFDYGVNSGIARAGRVLRAVLGLPSHDWHIDNTVIAALSRVDPVKVIDAVNAERIQFLRRLPGWPRYGRGWGSRVVSVRSYSEHLAQMEKGYIQTMMPKVPADPEGAGSAKAYGDEAPDPAITPVILPPEASPAPEATQTESIDSLGTEKIAQISPVAPVSDPPSYPSSPEGVNPVSDAPRPPTMLGSKTGWAAVGLGGSGLLEGMQQANDYASQLSQAKWNWHELNGAQVLHWIVTHPLVLLPVVVLSAAVFVWFEHRRYTHLVHELRNKQ